MSRETCICTVICKRFNMSSNLKLTWNGGIKSMKLWYDKPAQDWNEALPLGNGKIGAMVYGSVHVEQVQLNEDSVWYGGPRDRNNPDTMTHLPQIREMIFNGQIKEAEKLAAFALTGVPEGQRHYETLGNLFLFFDEEGEVENYHRALDLETAILTSSFTKNGVSYRREAFTSYPSQVFVMHLTADQLGSLSFHTQLARGNSIWNRDPFSKYTFKYQVGFNAYVDENVALSQDSVCMKGRCGGEDAISFASVLKIKVSGGTVQTIGNTILVEGANTATIYLAAATTFREADPLAYAVEEIEQATLQTYDQLKREHIADYESLFHRVHFKLSSAGDSLNHLPTDTRLERVRRGERDDDLIPLYFQYGRYLMIAGSRPGSLPLTLQGIWNQDMLPVWDSKYTININTQMNYWPSEACNLADCHLPLFDLIERMREPGRITARKMYGCNGFMAHHNTDIWGDTAPQDVCLSSSVWVMGAAWLCLHLWEHYEYSKDLDFLASAYETMKESAVFLSEYMIEDREGRLVICPTISPENEYLLANGKLGVLCSGASMDAQIVTALFESCIQAAEELSIHDAFVIKIKQQLQKIPQPQIGRYGQIQEWADDYEEVDPGHRHISHLFALHPGQQITIKHTPLLAQAARQTLERRLQHGGGHTGWSRAWITNMWVRLQDGQLAYDNINALLGHSTLPNLFCDHPPFQIDGNFGGTAAITEMLMQSHGGEIHLLPAIPSHWTEGSISGLRAKGGVELSFSWRESRLEQVSIKASATSTIWVRCGQDAAQINVVTGEIYTLNHYLELIK